MRVHCTVREVAPLNLWGNEWRIRWQFLLCALRIKNIRTGGGGRSSDSDGYSCLGEKHHSQCSSNWLIRMTGRGWSGGVRPEALSEQGEVWSHPWLSSQQRPGLFWKGVVNKSGWVQSGNERLLLWSPTTALRLIYFKVRVASCHTHVSQLFLRQSRISSSFLYTQRLTFFNILCYGMKAAPLWDCKICSCWIFASGMKTPGAFNQMNRNLYAQISA